MENTKPTSMPVLERDRIITLDAIRGFALLGILVMNIQSFSMINSAYFFPHNWGDLSGLNGLVWKLGRLLADGKFISLFSMLFGAGICLMTGRAADRGAPVAKLHYRRMLVLLLIGYVHAYFFWHGDILVTYALCGMIIYPLRRVQPAGLIAIGLGMGAIAALIGIGTAASAPQWPEDARQSLVNSFLPAADEITRELEIYRGGGLAMLKHRAVESLMMQTQVFWFWSLWRDGGAMLLGMAFFKLGLLSGRASKRTYGLLALFGLAIGLALVVTDMRRVEAAEWEFFETFFVSAQFNLFGAYFIAMAYFSLVAVAIKAGWPLLRLAAAGRMALSNYLGQTLICTAIFYGPGPAAFGHVPRIGQLGIVVAIWVLQLAVSRPWLERYHFGPVEWLWRSMTYGKKQRYKRG